VSSFFSTTSLLVNLLNIFDLSVPFQSGTTYHNRILISPVETADSPGAPSSWFVEGKLFVDTNSSSNRMHLISS